MPDSATMTRSSGTSGRRRLARSRSMVNVFRSRLLTPMIAAPSATARRTSDSSWASTRASRPKSVAACRSAAMSPSASAATMIRMASAPAARASATW